MSTVNKVILVGNLGNDPEKVDFSNGGSIVKFPIATAEKYKNKEGNLIEKTEWHNIVVGIPRLMDVCMKYLNKGSKVYVEGKLRTRSWEQDGQKKYMTEISIDNLTMLGGKSADTTSTATSQQEVPPPMETSDDLPF